MNPSVPSSEINPNRGEPRVSVADVQRLAAVELSLPSRIGYSLLLIVSLSMSAAVGSLLVTEPTLPARTSIAFALIVAIALAWAAFATWVLARRRVLFGSDRVIAARMGVTFAAVAAAAMAALGLWGGGGRGAYLGAAGNGALAVIAVWLLLRARRRVAELARRRRALEATFAGR